MRGRRVFIGGWLVMLTWVTSQQVHVWDSEWSLWTRAVSLAPGKGRPMINLGRAAELEGRWEDAERAYLRTTSLALDPRRDPQIQKFAKVAAENNIAHLRMKQGQHATAMKILDQVLTEWPGFPYAAFNRAAILSEFGACQAAAQSYAMTRQFPELGLPPAPACVEATE